MDMILVFTTVDSEDAAQRLAQEAVQRNLAACVQAQAIRSTYRWQGQVRDEAEFRLMAKTTPQRAPELLAGGMQRIRKPGSAAALGGQQREQALQAVGHHLHGQRRQDQPHQASHHVDARLPERTPDRSGQAQAQRRDQGDHEPVAHQLAQLQQAARLVGVDASEMPKNDRICKPSSALAAMTMNTVTEAIHTVRRRCAGPKP